jgi:hypothetical protein
MKNAENSTKKFLLKKVLKHITWEKRYIIVSALTVIKKQHQLSILVIMQLKLA